MFYVACLFVNSFQIKLFLCDFKGGRMIEVEDEEQEEKLREVGHLLLEVMCAKSQTLFAKLNICFLISLRYMIFLFFLHIKRYYQNLN